MSFDLFLERFESGESAQVDRVSVLKLLRQHCQDSEDQFGFYLLKFPDGSHTEFQAKGLESSSSCTGCTFHLRGFSPTVLTFIFDVALSGDMVIFNAQGKDSPDNPLAILVHQTQKAHLPQAAARHPIVCTSPRHLGQQLGLAFEEWTEFRDSVISKRDAP